MIGRRAVIATLALALLAVSFAAEAQPTGPVRAGGILGHTPAASFETGLRELGWVEGKNVRFERRVSTDDGTLARFATELSRIPVDVIFAGNAPATRAAMWVEAGGLMPYGVHPGDLYRRAATYADRVLRGAKRGDLPVE